VAVDAGTLAATPRRADLFGVPRGSSPPWAGGERSFVGGTTEDSTGLTHLGAREYDPRLGRFVSVDPVIDPDDPQQLNAYAYANNNPASMSDPDGRKYFVDADGLVTMPSIAHATPQVLNQVQAKLNKLAPMYAARERARQASARAVSRAAQHDWNGVDGARGRVGGYNARPVFPWMNKPPVVMHRDNSFGAQMDRTISGAVGIASSATAWGIRQTAGRVLDPITQLTGATVGVCVGGSAAAFAMSVGGSACYIQAPDGSAAITLNATSAAGPGLGATAGVGGFVSNAKTVDDVGGPFIHTEASAAFVGGISGSFDIGTNSKGEPIWTATVMPSIGAKASLGVGISDTWVLPHWFTPGH
jgi:RHS repeat-associated protein